MPPSGASVTLFHVRFANVLVTRTLSVILRRHVWLGDGTGDDGIDVGGVNV